MILIADSGSTKTEWSYITKSRTIRFTTKGLNPYFISEEEIRNEILQKIPSGIICTEVKNIHFYGSGCGRMESQNIIENVLQVIFPQAIVEVNSDLVGAAIACYGNQSGIVAILGTGMNVGYWDGTILNAPMPSLGYILGDAGSGAVLGKKLIQSVFERTLPEYLIERFQDQHHLVLSELLENVYKKPQSNAYLASFVPFLVENKNEMAIQQLLQESFDKLSEVYVKPISEKFSSNKISFVGSLSQLFRVELELSLSKNRMVLCDTIAKPIVNMESFYINCL